MFKFGMEVTGHSSSLSSIQSFNWLAKLKITKLLLATRNKRKNIFINPLNQHTFLNFLTVRCQKYGLFYSKFNAELHKLSRSF